MASAKCVGYLGGAAVAAGVGVAMAVGGQATAHAETDTGADTPTRTAKVEKLQRVSPTANIESRLDRRRADIESRRVDVEKRVADVQKKFAEAKLPKVDRELPKFDPADAVENLKKQFSTATAPKLPATASDSVLADKAARAAKALAPLSAVQTTAAASDTAAAPDTDAPFTNPFRADDPDPTPAGMFGPALSVRNVVLGVSPDVFDPFVREGFEAGYRVSQMIPWVNLPVPLLQIAGGTIGGDQRATQVAINQLLLTLPPIGILYYGYDQIADLLNVEMGAARFKENFYTTAWDTIDFLNLLHNKGESGLPR
ncbi:hypothetical protein [Mycobacterium sp. ACS4331]|uniref:hypothetical protein n=1 Tax=Mycobacterium sp. ACS4331 TaxID=1834121 RepID=UPI000B0DF279|nr:hypothetical protein [Mycobacterium sp. ACS4331]